MEKFDLAASLKDFVIGHNTTLERFTRIHLIMSQLDLQAFADLELRLHMGEWGIYVQIPYDKDVLRKVRRILGDQWEHLETRQSSYNGDVFVAYAFTPDIENGKSRYSAAKFEVTMCADKIPDGSACQRVKVSEEPVIRTTYKVVCDGVEVDEHVIDEVAKS